MNTSIAVNIFLTQCVREQSIPFNVSKEEKPNERLRKSLQESEDILSGKVKAKKYDKFEDVLKDKDNDI